MLAALVGCSDQDPAALPGAATSGAGASGATAGRGWDIDVVAEVEGVERPLAAPDLTGDGASDLVVVVPELTEVRVLAGPINERTAPAVLIHGVENDFGFGRTPFVGDIDGDGMTDLALGSAWEGRLYVYFGPLLQGDLSTNDADLVVQGQKANFIGTSAWVGDFDGDGNSDLVVSAPGEPEEACSGRDGTLVFLGPFEGTTLSVDDADVRLVDEDFDDCHGWFVSVADLDVDGRLDLALGSRSGEARVYFAPLGPGTLTTADADLVLGDEETRFAEAGTAAELSGGDGIDLALAWGHGNTHGVALLTGPFAPGVLGEAAITRAFVDPAASAHEPALLAHDFDGDGERELVYTWWGSDAIRLLTGPIALAASDLSDADASFTGVGFAGPLSAADVAGDALPELVVQSERRVLVLRLSRTF